MRKKTDSRFFQVPVDALPGLWGRITFKWEMDLHKYFGDLRQVSF